MEKEDVVYTHTMEYYSASKKKEILPSATIWIELQGMMPSEISQRKKHCVIFTYKWNLKEPNL